MKTIKRKNFHSFLLLVILIITSILFFQFYVSQEGFLKPKVVFALSFGEPVGNYLTNLRSWINDLFHFNDLRKKVDEIRSENINLISRFQDFRKLQEESRLLKEALKIKNETAWSLEMAEIVLTDPSGLSGSFWINKGSKLGLAKGMNIIVENKILVGRLIECFDHYCRGESIFNSGTRISVEDLRSAVLAVAEMDSRGNFRLKLVPYDSDIEIGDILVTSAENANFLKGLLVAKVQKAGPSPDTSSVKEFILEPLLNFSRLSSVFVIKDITPRL
jgi:rod shape-determining protein MreC